MWSSPRSRRDHENSEGWRADARTPAGGPDGPQSARAHQRRPRAGVVVGGRATCNPTSGPGCEASAPVTLHGNQAIIEVLDEFTRGQLEGRLRAQIEDGLTAVFGREIRLGVTVNPTLVTDRADHPTTPFDNSSTSRHVDTVCDRPGPAPAATAADEPALERPARRCSRPGSTPSTPSRPSSSARPTGSPTRPRSRSPRRPARPTTRCWSTATPAWARPTCCTRSATTCAASTPGPRCATSPARSSPTSSSTRSATTGRTGSSAATATSTCC